MGQPERGSCDHLAMVSCFLHPFLIEKHYSCIEMFDGVSHWFFLSYTVNITFGICSCMVGKDSSPCKHQYVLWVTNVGHCINFSLQCLSGLQCFKCVCRKRQKQWNAKPTYKGKSYQFIHDLVIDSIFPKEILRCSLLWGYTLHKYGICLVGKRRHHFKACFKISLTLLGY